MHLPVDKSDDTHQAFRSPYGRQDHCGADAFWETNGGHMAKDVRGVYHLTHFLACISHAGLHDEHEADASQE